MKPSIAILLFLLAVGAAAQTKRMPIVFIGGEGSDPNAQKDVKHTSGDDQTIEVARIMLKECSELSLTRDQDSADYILVLNRGKEYGMFANAVSQVMLLDPKQNVLYANKKGTVKQAVKDGCRAILEDWKSRRLAQKEKEKDASSPTQ